MKLHKAAVATLRSKRFWWWELGGAVIYGIPVAIRFITKSVSIPFLNFPGFWVGHFIPGNFVEKILVNAFFPGGAGGVAGEIFASNRKGEAVKGKAKYLHRLGGALLQTAVWSAFQYFGYSLSLMGPYGSNIFESIFVFPINFVLAAFSIFTPDVVGFIKSRFKLNAVKR
ncbi:hypothetical protein MUP38_06185 [Candidatus Bathyarchaeota archaeon]|nr:hypothetical protein [Candidatus Bathyarchaeota archaeon]